MWQRVWPGGNINWAHFLVFQQFANAEDVIGVADGDAAMKRVGPHNHGDAYRRFCRIATLGLGNEAALRDSVVHEVILAHATLGERWVGSGAACSDYDGSDSTMKQVERVIKAGL